MTKSSTVYRCTSCSATLPQWEGRCARCHEWNTLVEIGGGRSAGSLPSTQPKPTLLGATTVTAPRRVQCSLSEVDRILGGGLLLGSVVLLGGEPGIGKSTLAMQLMASYRADGLTCVYVSGEESEPQIAARSSRLGLDEGFELLVSQDIADVRSVLSSGRYDLVVVDSIQAFFDHALELSRNSHAYLRTIAEELTSLAKLHGVTLVLLSQINKEGALLGPKALEHLVDAVIFFEGDRETNVRILRAVKNRFGRAPESASLLMSISGLVEVDPDVQLEDPALVELPGRVRYPAMFGSKAELVEIQALVLQSRTDGPRRIISEGFDSGRLGLILAILDKVAKTDLSSCQVAVQVTGGREIEDPGADLAVALALISSYFEIAVPLHACVFGELSLLGEVRRVADEVLRVECAQRSGFRLVIGPTSLRELSVTCGLRDVLAMFSLGGRSVRAVG